MGVIVSSATSTANYHGHVLASNATNFALKARSSWYFTFIAFSLNLMFSSMSEMSCSNLVLICSFCIVALL